jgi:hypothetical protein
VTAVHDSRHTDAQLMSGSSGRVDRERERRVPEAAAAVDQRRGGTLVENRRCRPKITLAAKRQLSVPRKLPQSMARVTRKLGIDDVMGDAGRDGRGGTPTDECSFGQPPCFRRCDSVHAVIGLRSI